MFSVIIPLYNKELSIKNTIQSVLNQSYQDFEIVVVNDGSTDNSIQVVEQINDTRIRIINKNNGGVSSARNRGIKESKYEWIAFLDGDDLWEEDHLETLNGMIQVYPADKVFTTSYIQSNQTETERTTKTIDVIDNYFKAALERRVTWTSIMCVNKEVFDKVGGFNIKLSRGEDLDLWARIGREYRYIKSNLITAVYNVDSENSLVKTVHNIEKYYLPPIRKVACKYEKKYNLNLATVIFIEMIYNKNYINLYNLIVKYKLYSITILFNGLFYFLESKANKRRNK